MKTVQLAVLVLAAALLSPGPDAAEAPSPEQIGLPIGQPAPAFTAKDQNGREISLESLLKKGPVALVFFRSADWCVYCKLQLVDLQRNLWEIEATGGHLVGISYDSVEILKRFSDQRITFPLLSDAGSKTIDAYGIRQKDVSEPWNGVAYHRTFILDQKGVIRAKLFQVSYRERRAVDALVMALKDARKEP